jgi:hypothetical protein
MNDKCATGMGRNVETICDLLQVPIEEIGELSLDVPSDPEPVATTCAGGPSGTLLRICGRLRGLPLGRPTRPSGSSQTNRP